MLSPKCRNVPTQHSHCMRNVWSGTDHCIHWATDNTFKGNIFHVLYFFLCLWTLFRKKFYTYSNKNLSRFTPIHVETLQDGFNIFSITYLELSASTISPYLHFQNEVSSIDILHVELGGKLWSHLLDKLHVVSDQHHVNDIQYYIDEVCIDLFVLYTMISLASLKTQSKDVRFKLLVPNPRWLLQAIKGFLKLADQLFLSLGCKTFRSLHVNFLF